MRTIQVTRAGVDRLVRNAGRHLAKVNPKLPVNPDILVATAERFSLPVSLDLGSCPVARTLFIAAYSPDAYEPFSQGCDAIWRRFQQLATLERKTH